MDANFRLKNQLVSSYSADPGLGIGMAYFVPREGYEDYVLSKTSQGDVSGFLFYRKEIQLAFRSALVSDFKRWLKQTPDLPWG